MSAPTDRFLELLSERAKIPEPTLPELKPEFLESEAVQHYAKSLDDLPEADRDKRLQTLQAFAEYVDRTPDKMVEEIYNRETRKYRKRGFYSDNAKAFAAEQGGPQHVQLKTSNLIRAFFIANGFRLPPERPDWM